MVKYIQSGGWTYFLLFLLGFLSYIPLNLGTNVWLSRWTSDVPVNGTANPATTRMRLAVYGALCAGQGKYVPILLDLFLSLTNESSNMMCLGNKYAKKKIMSTK